MAGGRGVPEPFLFSLTRSVFHSPPRLPAAQRRFCAWSPISKALGGSPPSPVLAGALGRSPGKMPPKEPGSLGLTSPPPRATQPSSETRKEGAGLVLPG